MDYPTAEEELKKTTKRLWDQVDITEKLAAERNALRDALVALRDHYREWSIPGTLYNQVESALGMSNASDQP